MNETPHPFAIDDIEIVGMSAQPATDPNRPAFAHKLLVTRNISTDCLSLAVAIMQSHMAMGVRCIHGIVCITTDESGLEPTVHNARRRLALALTEAERLLTQVGTVSPRVECRPVSVEETTGLAGGRWASHSQGSQTTVECEGMRYTFQGRAGGVVFEKVTDGWLRMMPWASGEEDGEVMAVLMRAWLGKTCLLHEMPGWGRRRGLVRIPPHVALMDAIDAGNIAEELWKSAKDRLYSEVAQLPWQGDDSLFEEPFNDARDDLLAHLAAGGAVSGTWVGYDKPVATIDGNPVEPAAIKRILHSKGLALEYDKGVPKGHFKVTLRHGAKFDQRMLKPREHAVSFHAFEENCEHRRHWSETECTHRDGYREMCGVAKCPRVSAVYHQEKTIFNEDPHFNRFGEDWDTAVVALHPNTERSFAWRAAGEARISVVVNKAAHAWVRIGGGYLGGPGELPAIREAVALGHLEVIEETALGPVVGLAEMHRNAIRQQSSPPNASAAPPPC